MKIQVTVSWIVKPCSDVVGYQRFWGHFTASIFRVKLDLEELMH